MTQRLGWRRIVLLGGLGTVSPLATDMYLPAFPQIATNLGVTSTAVQSTLAAYLLPLAIGQVLFGALADAHGRRRYVIGGSALLVLGSAVCATAPTIGLLVAGRTIQGLGGAAAMVSGRAMIADLLDGRRAARAYIAVGTAAGLGPILAPSLGAWIADVSGWRSIFWLIGLTQVALLAVAISIPETLAPGRRTSGGALRTLLPRVAMVFGSVAFRWRVTVSTASFVALFAYIASSPFVADELGFSTRQYTVMFAVNGAGLMAVSSGSAALVVRLGRNRVMTTGLWVSLLGALALCLAAVGVAQMSMVLLGFFGVCCAKGTIGGSSYSYAAAAAPDAAGLALATMAATQFAAGALATVLVGLGPGPPVVSVAVTITAVSVIALAAHARAERCSTPATISST
ncbi:MAG: Bcr/CflA family efflux MFS transporter [Nocardioidaceae bacterium]